jgi:hypothetical protein
MIYKEDIPAFEYKMSLILSRSLIGGNLQNVQCIGAAYQPAMKRQVPATATSLKSFLFQPIPCSFSSNNNFR